MIFFGIAKETLIYGLGMSQRDVLNFDQIGPAMIAEQTGLEADSDVVADVVTMLEWLNGLMDKLEDEGFTARGADVVSPESGAVGIHIDGSDGAAAVINLNLWRSADGKVRVVVEREDAWEENTVIRKEHVVLAEEMDEDAMVVRGVLEEHEAGSLAPVTENFAETIDTVVRLFDAIAAAEAANAEQ